VWLTIPCIVSAYQGTPRKSISVADSMLTPLSARLRTMAESQAPDDYAEAMHQLGSRKIRSLSHTVVGLPSPN
jgi:hypothetical protein